MSWRERLRELRAVFIRLLKAFAWSLFIRQKFTFFIAKMNRDDLTTLCGLIKAGKLTPEIDRRYPLDETADAPRLRRKRHARRKSSLRRSISLRTALRKIAFYSGIRGSQTVATVIKSWQEGDETCITCAKRTSLLLVVRMSFSELSMAIPVCGAFLGVRRRVLQSL